MLRTNPLIALACALSVFACNNGPSQHDPARYGNVRVGVSTQLSDPNRLIDAALNQLDALGPDFIRVNESDFHSITIAPDLDAVPSPGVPCQRFVRYAVETKTIYIDQQCLATSVEYHQSIINGVSQLIGRIVGMRTICIDQYFTSPDCSPVGRGRALMNGEPDIMLPTSGEFRSDLSVSSGITELDLAEYRLHGHPL